MPYTQNMTVNATCGHKVTFKIDPERPMDDRIAKYKNRKCGPCRVIDNNDKVAREASIHGLAIPKGQGPKHLPAGTFVSLTLLSDGKTWKGSLMADGFTETAEGTGMMGLLTKLTTRWLTRKGYRVRR